MRNRKGQKVTLLEELDFNGTVGTPTPPSPVICLSNSHCLHRRQGIDHGFFCSPSSVIELSPVESGPIIGNLLCLELIESTFNLIKDG